MAKVVLSSLAAVLAAIFAARVLYNTTAETDIEPIPRPWAQHAMEFVTWNDERWTAWIRKDKFELLPREEGRWQRHTNVSLAFIDWQGQPWRRPTARATLPGIAGRCSEDSRADWRSSIFLRGRADRGLMSLAVTLEYPLGSEARIPDPLHPI